MYDAMQGSSQRTSAAESDQVNDQETAKEHHRDQSALNRDLLRWVATLSNHEVKSPYGVEIIAGLEDEYYDTRDIDQSVIYDRLTDLCDSGLLTKHNTTEDGRKKAYVLTDRGEKVLKELHAKYCEQVGGLFN